MLGTGERSVDRWIGAGKLRSAERPVPGRKPVVIVHPEDVEKLRVERRPLTLLRTPQDVVRSEASEDLQPGAGKTGALARIAPNDAAVIAALFKAVAMDRKAKPWLTLAEAVEYSGLPKSWLLAQAREGGLLCGGQMAINVGTPKQPRWRFSREVLDA